jgi:antirestriction protein
MTEFNLETIATIVINVNDEEHQLCVNFDFGYTDYTNLEDLKEYAQELLFEQWTEEHATPVDIDADAIEIEITNLESAGIPESYRDITSNEFWEFLEACYNTSYDAEVVEAGLYCGVNASDIDEAYSGTYSSNEDFAREIADEIGAIDKDAKWPMNCIDWEQAARELMYDYSEHNTHYFRNL